MQNNQGYYWSEEEVNDKLREKLVDAFDTIYELAQNRKIDMRLATYIVGIKRTAEADSLPWLGINRYININKRYSLLWE